ncbi:MAG: PadR family transcriptional regulator [Elusimicrobia bacterium CG08_land_8_20_14_0_20_44_26]|nr:MAG: PadR family transcriptional regulator [Elusimicrobia bacterium CG08_land_8_20_14_0_20_44_26]
MCKDNKRGEKYGPEKCECPSGRMTRFTEPCLLFFLAKKPSYGYELMDKLEQFGFTEGKPDPAMIYRTLRYLEKEGFVKSKWDTGGTGPAKRNYKITAEGVDLLHGWARSIRQRKEVLDKFIARYKKYFKGKMPKFQYSSLLLTF